MADEQITGFADGGAFAPGDEFVIARSGTNYKVSGVAVAQKIYDYTVTGADKASIDTGVDAPAAGSNDWTNGTLLEVWIITRTDDAGATSTLAVTLNNDSGANYDREALTAANTTVSSGVASAQANWILPSHGSGGTANYPGITRLSLPGFAGTTFYKVGESASARLDATAGNDQAYLQALGYRSVSAITRLAVAASAGQKLKVGSRLLIYKRL